MCHRKRTPLLIGVTTALLLVIFVLPIFLDIGSGSLFCPIEPALAQEESPCLVQQATISGQEVQILQLQLTNNASQLQMLDMQATLVSQARIINQLLLTVVAPTINPVPQIVTVPVLITATLDPNVTPAVIVITATPSPDSKTDISAQPTEQDDLGLARSEEGTALARLTATLPPTVVGSQVEIVRIIGAGEISSEGVEIRNSSGVVELTGWTLEDSDGNIFIFPEQRLFTNGLLTVYTRRGFNTPIALYWGRSEPILDNENDFLILSDQDGEVQATYRLSENANE